MRLRSVALALCAAVLPGAGLSAQQQTRNPHGKLQEQCAVCHGPQGWVPARVVASFDHAKKGFPLSGAHASATCRSCHVSLNFGGVRTECTACHKDAHRGELGQDCSRCHTPRSFHDQTVMARAHQMTRFPLSGAHGAVGCSSCHRPAPQGQLAYAGTSVQCVDCHRTQYVAAKSPDHVAGGFPQSCTQCHSPTTWASARFNHDASSFPLTGAHRATTCQQCHGDGVYNGKSTTCVSCHQPDYSRATPNHVSSGFSTTCQSCHTTTTWTGAAFNHDLSSFPLTGAHRTVTCQQCHGDGVYNGKTTTCVSCHQSNYNTVTPNHVSAGFSTTCQTCHTTTTWTGAVFNHDASSFPLTGAHRTATCQQCHGDGVYNGKNTACVSCHQPDYNTATPNHPAAGFPMTCQTCHTTTGWTGAAFNHTWFRVPHHGYRACTDCHTTPTNYAVFVCTTCHTKTKTDSKHQGRSGYVYNSQNCYACHR